MSAKFAVISAQFALLACLLAPSSHAATVQLQLIDELDQPIGDVDVRLVTDRGLEPRYLFGGQRGRADPAGRVTFEGVPPGRYVAHLPDQRGRFVDLEDHPSIRLPSITVENEDDVVESTLRLIRGAPVVFRVSAGGDPLPSPRLILHDLDRGYRTEIQLRDLIEKELRLVPGRWTAQVQPIPGYLLTSVEINRTVLPGYVAEVDLPAGEQNWYVNFEYSAPATVWGYVTYEGEQFGVEVVARLEEAGPWLPAVQARGGSIYEYARARPKYPKWDYEMVVPDGRWTVFVRGADLEDADPRQVDIVLAPGEERRIDFTVRGTPGEGEERTRVSVRDLNGMSLNGAPVEVWPADPLMRGDAPLARKRTRWFGIADIAGLDPATEYLFVAGGEGFVENSATMKPPRPNDEPNKVVIQLKGGATVHAVSQDENDGPAPSVEISLTRQDETSSLMTAPEVLEWARHPVGRTDDTGHLWLRGVYPGRYRVEGTLVGDDAERYFVEFRESSSDDWEREIERTYVGEETDEFELRLAPAAGVRAALQCSDGTEFPEETDILVLPADRSWEGTRQADWLKRAAHSSSGYVLEGDRRDRFEGGPLAGGAYHVLVRPEGHNRWTWAIGTEFPEDASVVSAAPGGPTDLGAIAVDCAPAISIRPVPPEGVELPDLVNTGLYDPTAEIDGTISSGDRERRLEHARMVVTAGEVQFRDLPEGEARLEGFVRNPFFLPHPELPVSVEATLQRGITVHVDLAVAGIGGAVDIVLEREPAAVVAIRLIRDLEDGTDVRIVETEPSGVLVPSLPSGDYRLELCGDLACDSSSPLPDILRVERGILAEYRVP